MASNATPFAVILTRRDGSRETVARFSADGDAYTYMVSLADRPAIGRGALTVERARKVVYRRQTSELARQDHADLVAESLGL